jgi:hypothetical protein
MALVEAEHQQITYCPLCHGDMWETTKTHGLTANGPSIFLASSKHCGHILMFSPELIKAPMPDLPFETSSSLTPG